MATNNCQCGVCALLSEARQQRPTQIADKEMLARLAGFVNKPYNPQINYALIAATRTLHRM